MIFLGSDYNKSLEKKGWEEKESSIKFEFL